MLGAKTANVLDSMPKSAQPGAKKAIQDIYNAEDRDHAEAAVKTFAKFYGAKFPKAVKKITGDQGQLLAFFDFPAEHWSTCAPRTRSGCCTPITAWGVAHPTGA